MSGKIRRNKQLRDIIAYARSLGAEPVVERGARHYKVRIGGEMVQVISYGGKGRETRGRHVNGKANIKRAVCKGPRS